MRTAWILAVATVLLLLVASVPGSAEPYTAEFKIFYYPMNVNLSMFGPATWNTSQFGGDIRWYFSGPWGVHLNYSTGNEGNWGGGFLGATSGSDNVYFGDIFYDFLNGPRSARVFAGYGQIQENTTFPVPNSSGLFHVFGGVPVTQTLRTTTSSGFRVGGDAAIPLDFVLPELKDLAFQVSVAWYPSNSTSLSVSIPGVPAVTSNASAWDYSASLQWTHSSGFLIEAGYRWINANTGAIGAPTVCPCTANVNGPFIAVGYRWH